MYRELEKTESDTKTKLISAIASEYVSKLKPKAEKPSKKSKGAQASLALAEKITFADITVWFYKKNCPQSLEEARMIWETLPETIIQKQDVTNYFKAYAEQVLDKHDQYISYNSQCKKLEKLITRTTNFTTEIRSASPQLSRSSFDESNLAVPESFAFEIVLDSVVDHDLESLFQRNDLLGHQIEFLGSETSVRSSMSQTSGNKIKFQKEKLNLEFSAGCESIEVNLCEVYGNSEEVTDSKCIARRNFDFFTNINEWFLREILEECEPEELRAKWENSRKFEIFLLKKQGFSEFSIVPKKKKDLMKSSLSQRAVKLNMSVEVPTIETVQDFQAYLSFCDARVECLRTKLRNARAQALNYKRSISLLLAPFENVKFDEKSLFFEETLKRTQKQDCKIF